MKISEYSLLEEAFHRSFGFMLNRIEEEVGSIDHRFDGTEHDQDNRRDRAEDLCFNEFIVAMEEMGIELETVGRDITEYVSRSPIDPPR